MSGRPLCMQTCLVAALFLGLALAATWPIATDPAHLSVASLTNNDFRFNLYVIFWGARALTTNPLALHHTNMFHPERYTFAYSDIELSHSLLMLPVILASNNPMLTYNLLLIMSIVLGGTGFFLLGRTLTGSSGLAVFGAALWVFNPVHFTRYQQIPLFGDHWLPWFAWALWRFLETSAARGSGPWAVTAALFYCLHALTGSHNAVFGAVVGTTLVVYHATTRRLWKQRRFLNGLLAMAVIAAAILAPVFWPYAMLEEVMAAKRGLTLDLANASARPYELLSASSRFYRWLDTTLGWPSVINRQNRELATYLFPGVVTLLLAAIGIASRFRRCRELKAWLWVGGLCFLLALGTYGGLYTIVGGLPVLRLIRVPTRFMLPCVFALAILATFGAVALAERLRSQRARTAVLASLVLWFAVEAGYAPLSTRPFDPRPGPVERFLAAQPGDFAVVEFPIDPANYTISMRQVFRSIHHWKKLLVGYSGYQSDENVRRLRELNASFPSDESLERLDALGVRFVIARQGRMRPSTTDAIRAQLRLEPVRKFDATWVYRLLPAPD